MIAHCTAAALVSENKVPSLMVVGKFKNIRF
jgi:hypothetical protein